MPTYHFEEVAEKQKITVCCSVCQKKMQRTVVSSQTVNPFNKNKNGRPKTYREVVASAKKNLPEKVNQALAKTYLCQKCHDNGETQ